jgi:hypothetical protein
VSSDFQTKALTAFAVKDADRGIVTAHVTTTGVVDRDREVIMPGAIREGASVMLSAYGHAIVTMGEAPVGKGQINFFGSRGILTAQYWLSVPRARDAFEVVKQMGSAQQWSLGFRVVRSSRPSAEWQALGAHRLLDELEVFEGSPVVRGASVPATGTLAAKALAAPERSAELEQLVAELARREAWIACCKEPHGFTAWDVAESHYRWASNGLVQRGPIVRHFAPDNRRAGFYDPTHHDEIWISRGMSLEEVIDVSAHEAAHAWACWDPSEDSARIAAKGTVHRYMQKFKP